MERYLYRTSPQHHAINNLSSGNGHADQIHLWLATTMLPNTTLHLPPLLLLIVLSAGISIPTTNA